MIENEAPAAEAETGPADLTAILADDQSAPAPMEQPKAEAEKPAEAAAPEVKPEAKAEDGKPPAPHWYRETLKEKEQRIKTAERRAADLERQLQSQQQQRPAPNYNDPQAVFQSFEQRLAVAELTQSLALSARFARREHGPETFEQTREWLEQRPDIELWAQSQEDPWEAAIARFKQERLVAEIGDDPTAYREKLRQELLAEIGQTAQPQAMTQRPNIPAPASGQRSAAPRSGDGRFTGPTPLGDILKR